MVLLGNNRFTKPRFSTTFSLSFPRSRPFRAAAFFVAEMALVSKQPRILNLTGAAAFLGIPFGEFAQFVRVGQDLPECTNPEDLVAVRFHRDALERWKLAHTVGTARA